MTLNTYRVLVTGSRDWVKTRLVMAGLRAAEIESKRLDLPMVVVEGGCPEGADHIARMYAKWRGWGVETHPAKWDFCSDACPPYKHRVRKKLSGTRRIGDRLHPGQLPDYCPRAGPLRNREMVAAGADICLAFIRNHSSGASGCASLARQNGISTHSFFDCDCHRGFLSEGTR